MLSLQRKVRWLCCCLSLIKDLSCLLKAHFALDPSWVLNDSGKLFDRFIIRILCWILSFACAIFNIHKISENYYISVFMSTGQEDPSNLGPSSFRDYLSLMVPTQRDGLPSYSEQLMFWRRVKTQVPERPWTKLSRFIMYRQNIRDTMTNINPWWIICITILKEDNILFTKIAISLDM